MYIRIIPTRVLEPADFTFGFAHGAENAQKEQRGVAQRTATTVSSEVNSPRTSFAKDIPVVSRFLHVYRCLNLHMFVEVKHICPRWRESLERNYVQDWAFRKHLCDLPKKPLVTKKNIPRNQNATEIADRRVCCKPCGLPRPPPPQDEKGTFMGNSQGSCKLDGSLIRTTRIDNCVCPLPWRSGGQGKKHSCVYIYIYIYMYI